MIKYVEHQGCGFPLPVILNEEWGVSEWPEICPRCGELVTIEDIFKSKVFRQHKLAQEAREEK